MTGPESDESLIPPGTLKSSPGRTLDRVRAALQGEFSADLLEPDEERLFHDMWAVYMAGPNPERDALVAKMYAEGGYVGEDERGRLVRTLTGGGIEVIHESIDAVDRWRMELVAHRREVDRVLVAAEMLVGGDRNRAISWFESEPLRDFDGQTPDAIVRQGKAQDVIDYIEAIAGGAPG
jgi:Protein of unknown function (DUF2384)